VVARALAWLKQHPEGPFFLWVHLYDAHDPYQPPEPYKTKYAAEPYDGGIAYEDSVVGTLLQQLKARGLYDGATIAVMATMASRWERTAKIRTEFFFTMRRSGCRC